MAPAGSSTRRRLLRRVADEVAAVRPDAIARVAIDGVDGAGKTTFADELARALHGCGRHVIRVSADDFLNARSIRYGRGSGSPAGFFLDSYDYAALRRLVLGPLGPGGTRRYRRAAFDRRADAVVTAPTETAPLTAILLLDGLFLHRDELYRLWDYSVFLDVAFAESVARCAGRDPAWPSRDVESPAIRRYVAGQRLYLSRCGPRRRATRVIDNTVLASPRLAS